jgi:hypothetical protein
VRKFVSILFLLLASLAAGLSEGPPLNEMGQPFKTPRAVFEWDVPTNVFPSSLTVYKRTVTDFSPAVVSSMERIGHFRDADKKMDGTAAVFSSPDGARQLRIDPATGDIEYSNSGVVHGGTTNVSVGVPEESELLPLTMKLLPKLGIKVSEIQRQEGSSKPEFNFYEPDLSIFTLNSVLVSNIPQRSVFFRRQIDSGAVVGNDEGGNGWIYFGSNHAISKISLKWPTLKPYKTFQTADFNTLEKWIRQGRARHGFIEMNVGDLDWPRLKKMTVKKAQICYVTDGNFIYPIASLLVGVDGPYGPLDVEIDVPAYDASK